MSGPGEARLRTAIQALRSPEPPREPITIEPTNALEAILIERIQHLENQIDRLQNRVNWLIGLIISTLTAIIIKLVIG